MEPWGYYASGLIVFWILAGVGVMMFLIYAGKALLNWSKKFTKEDKKE